jgi:hypothetical protein
VELLEVVIGKFRSHTFTRTFITDIVNNLDSFFALDTYRLFVWRSINSLVSVGNARKLINNKLRTHILHISIIRVRKMFRINTLTVVSTNTITLPRQRSQLQSISKIMEEKR